MGGMKEKLDKTRRHPDFRQCWNRDKIVLFSDSSTKLDHYIYKIYDPPFIVLTVELSKRDKIVPISDSAEIRTKVSPFQTSEIRTLFRMSEIGTFGFRRSTVFALPGSCRMDMQTSPFLSMFGCQISLMTRNFGGLRGYSLGKIRWHLKKPPSYSVSEGPTIRTLNQSKVNKSPK